MIKVLIIEDHNILIQGIKELLSNEESCGIVHEALTGNAGLQKVKTHPDIDVVLLDINLPDMNGTEVCKEIKKIRSELPVLTLTMHISSNYVKELISAGANGYILKDTSNEELIEAIESVASGHFFLSKAVKEVIEKNINKNSLSEDPGRQIPKLTSREAEVLKCIIEEMTTDEIAGKLFISSHTVISHRKNLLKKLGVKNTAGIVKVAFENNLIYEYLKK